VKGVRSLTSNGLAITFCAVAVAGCGSPSATPAAQYRAAYATFSAAATHFSAILSTLLPPVNNPAALARAGGDFASAIKTFDATILAIPFTGRAKADAAKLANADDALIADIALGINTPGTNLINDNGQAELDVNALDTDLGIPLPNP